MSNAERITLRLPVSLHAQLVALAEKEGVSLNQYIVLNLSKCLQCYSIEPHTGRDRATATKLKAPTGDGVIGFYSAGSSQLGHPAMGPVCSGCRAPNTQGRLLASGKCTVCEVL